MLLKSNVIKVTLSGQPFLLSSSFNIIIVVVNAIVIIIVIIIVDIVFVVINVKVFIFIAACHSIRLYRFLYIVVHRKFLLA